MPDLTIFSLMPRLVIEMTSFGISLVLSLLIVVVERQCEFVRGAVNVITIAIAVFFLILGHWLHDAEISGNFALGCILVLFFRGFFYYRSERLNSQQNKLTKPPDVSDE